MSQMMRAGWPYVYELIRKPGVASQASAAFSSASCSQCGAPIAVSSEAACAFCGAQLTSGQYDWTLDAVVPWSAQRASQLAFDEQGAIDHATPGTFQPGRVAARTSSRVELSLALLARIVAADG